MYSLLIAVLPLLARPVLSAPQNDLGRGLAVPDQTGSYNDASALDASVDVRPVLRTNKRRSLPPCTEGQVRKSRRPEPGSKVQTSHEDVGTSNRDKRAYGHATTSRDGTDMAAVFKEKKPLVSTTMSVCESSALELVTPSQTPSSSPIGENNPPTERKPGKRNMLYVQSEGSVPDTIPVDNVTHLLYAFACPDKIRGTVSYKSNEPTTQNLGKLYQLKKDQRNMKTLLSIGGYGYRNDFDFAKDPEKRKEFAKSAAQLMIDGSFDGLDVDWENINDEEIAPLLVELLKECRQELDKIADKLKPKPAHKFLLTAATQVAYFGRYLDIVGMDKYLDYWLVMTYDLEGSGWSSVADHHTDIYKAKEQLEGRQYRQISDRSKIHMGLPLYGRTFTTAGLRRPAEKLQSADELLYKDLPKAGAKEQIDKDRNAYYSYDEKKRELISYETKGSAKVKAKYINEKGLGGAFFWQAHGDKLGNDSLVRFMSENIGPLEQSPNWLNPESKFKLDY